MKLTLALLCLLVSPFAHAEKTGGPIEGYLYADDIFDQDVYSLKCSNQDHESVSFAINEEKGTGAHFFGNGNVYSMSGQTMSCDLTDVTRNKTWPVNFEIAGTNSKSRQIEHHVLGNFLMIRVTGPEPHGSGNPDSVFGYNYNRQ